MERRPVEVRYEEGRALLTLVRLGREGQGPNGLREVFTAQPNPVPPTIPVNLQHDGAVILDHAAVVAVRGDVLEATARIPEGVRDLVRLGRLEGASVEMRVRRDEVTPSYGASVRRILDWELLGASIVHRGAAGGSGVELRRALGASLSGFVGYNIAMDCSCPGGGCDEILFETGAFADLSEALATVGKMHQVVGRAVLSPTAGGLAIAVELIDVAGAQTLVELIDSDVDVYARPLLNLEESDTSEERARGGTLRVKRAAFDAVLIKAVAGGVSGLAPVKLARSGRALSQRRRLLIAGAA